MFVVSLSSKKLIKFLGVAIALCVVITAAFVFIMNCNNDITSNETLSVNNKAENMEQLLGYISSFGWEVLPEPDEVREVVIPAEFDDVYEQYNEIQLSQGYDLKKYSGERVKNWTFTILNYPGYESEECIKINLLVCDGNIIGGDVCSVELNGFMHGFLKE